MPQKAETVKMGVDMRRRLPGWLDMIVGSGGALIGIVALFAIGMMPQVLLAIVVSKGGGPMLLAFVALLCVGILWVRVPDQRGLLATIAIAVLWMAMLRGMYWAIFERGSGFFSANRVSALAMFGLALIGPALWVRLRRP